jgi:hypothetical protein
LQLIILTAATQIVAAVIFFFDPNAVHAHHHPSSCGTGDVIPTLPGNQIRKTPKPSLVDNEWLGKTAVVV